jgi:hypothetical protein
VSSSLFWLTLTSGPHRGGPCPLGARGLTFVVRSGRRSPTVQSSVLLQGKLFNPCVVTAVTLGGTCNSPVCPSGDFAPVLWRRPGTAWSPGTEHRKHFLYASVRLCVLCGWWPVNLSGRVSPGAAIFALVMKKNYVYQDCLNMLLAGKVHCGDERP